MNQQELDELIDRYLRDELDDAEKASLAEWLNAGEKNQVRFVGLIEMNHAVIGALKGLEAEEQENRSIAPQKRSYRTLAVGVASAASAASAASVVLLLISVFYSGYRRGELGGTGTASLSNDILHLDSPEEIISGDVAVVTAPYDARWKDATDWNLLETVSPGPHDLEPGIVQLEFYSGTQVILEGSGQFEIVSPNLMSCSYGSMWARVSDQAQGFTIMSPQYQLVDLGTEFGIYISRSGETSVHVFEGKVEL